MNNDCLLVKCEDGNGSNISLSMSNEGAKLTLLNGYNPVRSPGNALETFTFKLDPDGIDNAEALANTLLAWTAHVKGALGVKKD